MNIQERYLARPFSPWGRISQVPVELVQAALIFVFKIHGMPECIKVDNGRPLGEPQRQSVPVLALWLIALGIRVCWNRPRMPQDNAKVERSQGVLSNWTEHHKCINTAHLQARLWEEADFQNLHFPVRGLKGKTRLEAFPGLLHSGKDFNPHDFDLQRVLDFLSTGKWDREISQSGQVRIFSHRFQVGLKYANQTVSIKLKSETNTWEVFDRTGSLIKTIQTKITLAALWKLDLS